MYVSVVLRSTYLSSLLAIVKLFPPHVGGVHFSLSLLLNIIKRLRHLLQLALVQGVFETPPFLIFLLVLFELLLLLFELGEPRLNVLQQFTNLGAFRIRLSHDAEGL